MQISVIFNWLCLCIHQKHYSRNISLKKEVMLAIFEKDNNDACEKSLNRLFSETLRILKCIF